MPIPDTIFACFIFQPEEDHRCPLDSGICRGLAQPYAIKGVAEGQSAPVNGRHGDLLLLRRVSMSHVIILEF